MNPYPEQIQQLAESLAVCEYDLKDSRARLAQLEDAIVQAVLMAKGPDGKATFTNETTRKSEIVQRCAASLQCTALAKKIEGLEREKRAGEIKLERARGDFAVWKIEQKRTIAANAALE